MRPSIIIRYLLLLGLIFPAVNALAQNYAPGACTLIPGSQTCVDSTPCKTDSSGAQICLAGVALPPGSVAVTQSCWQYSYQYACSTSGANTCSTYQNNSSCSVTNSICQDKTSTGLCDEWQYTYQCQTQAAVTQQQMVCGNALFNSALLPTPSNPNNNFAQAAVAQEILNEGATYKSSGLLFTGVAETCTKGDYGLHNCCNSAPGGKSNAQVAPTALGNAASVVKYAGSAAVDWASPYVFDAMYNNGIWTDGLMNSFSNGDNLGTNLSSGGLSLSAYGFTYSTVAPGAVSGFSGGTVLAGNSSTGYLSFNPYVFVAMVVVMEIESMMACSSEEQLLAMHKGSGLSTFINEYCSSSSIFGCTMNTDNYCSFNSVLAEIINIQGKTQLGMDISNCQGITPAQLSQIDFKKIDFSAFTQSLVQNAQNNAPTSTSLNNGYSPILQNTTRGSSQSGASANSPAYP